MKVSYEHTDTFGGEANYSWGKRGTIELPSGTGEREIITAVKRELGLTGVKCNKEIWAEQLVLRPRGRNQIVFIDWE